MAESKSDPGFTFVDRRGRSDEAPPAQESPRERQVSPPAPPSSPPPSETGPPSFSAEAGVAASGQLRADLSSLCVMLYGDALVHLGQVPDPMSSQPRVDLEQAGFTIDLLAMLEAKTTGNRTPEESALLDEMLAALRMAYVRATRLT